MDLFNSYRDQFLYDEEESEEGEDLDPTKTDDEDDDDILKEPDEPGTTDWEEER